MDEQGHYDVGYGRPPKTSQFKKGQSGNPKGRPKGSKNLSTIVQAALNATVMVNENGKRRLITKLEAIVTQAVNKAAAGDPQAFRHVLNLLPLAEEREEETPQSAITPAQEKALVAQLLQRMNRQRMDHPSEAP